jgi:hypothetical protein
MTTLHAEEFVLIAPYAEVHDTPVPGTRPHQPDETGDTVDSDDDADDESGDWNDSYEVPEKTDPMM